MQCTVLVFSVRRTGGDDPVVRDCGALSLQRSLLVLLLGLDGLLTHPFSAFLHRVCSGFHPEESLPQGAPEKQSQKPLYYKLFSEPLDIRGLQSISCVAFSKKLRICYAAILKAPSLCTVDPSLEDSPSAGLYQS